jgi:3-hydroxy-3-methylglutaryl CoA synthase
VANYDEDSLTMSCEAALNALHGRDIKNIGACFLASTSAPYAEKSSAAILATVADLSPAVLTGGLGRPGPGGRRRRASRGARHSGGSAAR